MNLHQVFLMKDYLLHYLVSQYQAQTTMGTV